MHLRHLVPVRNNKCGEAGEGDSLSREMFTLAAPPPLSLPSAFLHRIEVLQDDVRLGAEGGRLLPPHQGDGPPQLD